MSELQRAAAAAPAPRLPLARSRVPEVCALKRERLLELLPTLWQQRLGIVVAPAGSGKTTLLSSSPLPAACLRPTTPWNAATELPMSSSAV